VPISNYTRKLVSVLPLTWFAVSTPLVLLRMGLQSLKAQPTMFWCYGLRLSPIPWPLVHSLLLLFHWSFAAGEKVTSTLCYRHSLTAVTTHTHHSTVSMLLSTGTQYSLCTHSRKHKTHLKSLADHILLTCLPLRHCGTLPDNTVIIDTCNYVT
jgi:hypothetical protein